MKKLSFLVSRQFLALLALVVIALVIWFVGPLVAFGGLKPLAGVGMRVLVIALLLTGVLLWLAGRSTSVVFVAALCLLIWYAAPLLAFGHAEPFAPESARMIAIAVVLTVFVVYWLFRLRQMMLEDEQFTRKLLQFGSRKGGVARGQPAEAGQRGGRRRTGATEGDAHRRARAGQAVSGQALPV